MSQRVSQTFLEKKTATPDVTLDGVQLVEIFLPIDKMALWITHNCMETLFNKLSLVFTTYMQNWSDMKEFCTTDVHRWSRRLRSGAKSIKSSTTPTADAIRPGDHFNETSDEVNGIVSYY